MPLLKLKIGWFTIWREFSERAGMVLLGEFLRSGWTNRRNVIWVCSRVFYNKGHQTEVTPRILAREFSVGIWWEHGDIARGFDY
jgi:hypothetical protein